MLGAMKDVNNNEHLLKGYCVPGTTLCALPVMLS